MIYMTRLLSTTQLARVTPLIQLRHHSLSTNPCTRTVRAFTAFRHFSTQPILKIFASASAGGRSKFEPLRPLMDSQSPESGTPAVESEDFVHIDNPQIESLCNSFVGRDEPTDVPGSSDHDSEESEQKKVLPEELSRSVMVLNCESTAEGGVCDVYLVGTAHVSQESCREVQAVISFLKPQVVFLELCSSRVTVLTPQNLKVPSMGEMLDMWKKKHNIFGILYSWFLAKIASKLEVFPGAEFRVAYEEAMKYSGRVILGDRPVQITLRRTWGKMPLWHKAKLLYSLFFQAVFLPSSEDLNKMLKEMDDVDMLTLVIQEMSKAFPTLMETLVHERDQYMSSTLLRVASENSSVVAVVGKGHLEGIKKHWQKPIAVKDLMGIPSPRPTFSGVRILTSVGVAVAGVGIISGLYLASKK
ncbi:TraB domain-containing protein [Quillaja saponaria]|uniref:TraB domain-containing protein n=1 Tax=Quillaja saponaria TaxID=32244 RepID=A0AAD7PAD5_QUISA|nr:TraB domain-containing protein [Quillaja saponaria]